MFLKAPFHSTASWAMNPLVASAPQSALPFSDYRITPHYPRKSPLDDVLRYLTPGTDQYVTEKYAYEISRLLRAWGRELRTNSPALGTLENFLDNALEAASLIPTEQRTVRSAYGLDAFRRIFSGRTSLGRDLFLREMKSYLAPLKHIDTAEFEIIGVEERNRAPLTVRIEIRYGFVGTTGNSEREERCGYWHTEWWREDSGEWKARSWTATEEFLSRARQPMFVDVSAQSLGHLESYQNQLVHGIDHWRTVLDGASGIDVYGNTGLAAGDFDNDGLDDLYVCQPPGLPNRLYRNRGDGTFEDVTESAGVGVLDGTACALFADFENKGFQDLLVVTAGGPLLFVNQGNGKFSLQRGAFRFVNPPAGTFTHASVADYDGDGRLDIYFCLYSYYLGLDQYHYPAPYFDARNGPPNFLFHNEGNGVFQDRTKAAGLDVDNNRYSFACTWNDFDSDGKPDLYVVNDFGRNNLYRNNGDGTFTSVSNDAHVDEPGAGMSACWLDFDNDGQQDIYAAGMWVPAGMRVFGQSHFHDNEPEEIRELYERHLMGNSLYRNLGNSRFQNVARQAGVEMGRWSWSTEAWDFDHDGHPDLYIANGYVSGLPDRDASSFFWRQVVAHSPATATPAERYERGWNAINELIRSDATWNGYERNVFYRNNQDGTFSDVSGSVGLDLLDDSRAFVLADLDQDGRLEIVLKNRTSPQVRVLHNAMNEIGGAIAFRLQGKPSNRDAIGAAVTVEFGGHRQTKLLQAGSGFLSQHTKELFFGVGDAVGPVRASIRWPSGLTQAVRDLPVNHRVEILEGVDKFEAKAFAAASATYAQPSEPYHSKPLPTAVETWLLQPLPAPDFTLPGLAGESTQLSKSRGHLVLLSFWGTAAPASISQLRLLQQQQTSLASRDVRVLCLNLDDPQEPEMIRSLVAREKLSLPILLATAEIAGVYNILYRYMFDRRRDLGLPTSLLLNQEGAIVKIYQGQVAPQQILEDLRSMPTTAADFMRNGLPMKGSVYLTEFRRNDFTYGVALFQRGYLEAAIEAFQHVIAAKPDNPEAYYNLGTLYLTSNALAEARSNLNQAVKLRPDYAEAWNNLGMVSAQQGQDAEAIAAFQKSLEIRPTYATALLNFGSVLRRTGDYEGAQKLLARALEEKPDDADLNYNMGMLYATQGQLETASEYLEKAVAARPDHADALNNLGVIRVRQKRYSEAKEKLESCIQVAPNFDQGYLNLARLYVLLDERAKAREVLEALLQRQPDHQLARQALEMLN